MTDVNNQKKIGMFIRSLREKRAITQQELATKLNTSQSVVARIESGGQNLTAGELLKIGEALEHKIISLTSSTDFRIEGGRKLSGSIVTNHSKNGAMGLMCASLLNSGTTVLHGIPRIEEVRRMLEVFDSLGIKTRWTDAQSLEVIPPLKFKKEGLLHPSVASMRSSLMLIPTLVAKLETFNLLHSGGCKMGERTMGAHRYALADLGVSIKSLDKKYLISKTKIKSNDVVLYESSDTAAINTILVAATIKAVTKISFAPPNYQVQEVCFFLEKMGVKIEGIGTTNLVVHGVGTIKKNIEYTNSEDPIESMMFISAAIVTKSTLTIKRCPIDFLSLELKKLEVMGLKYTRSKVYYSANGRTKLVDLKIEPSKLTAPTDKIHAQPYPGINSDNLPFFVPIVTQAKGTTLIHDWMWENRAIYFTELNRLGASITLVDPHRAFITGPTELKPSQVVCPPALRPAVIILIAMLGAKGTSILRNVYSITRGYEDVADRLNKIGAKIEIIKSI